jgi:ribonuclease HIII
MPAPNLTSYTVTLTDLQVSALRRLLEGRGFTFSTRPYTIFFAQQDKLSIAVYEK